MRTGEHELGYLARPDRGTHPGVVMIHDVWGLADHTRDLARRLAAEGFCVLAVDLYRRLDATEIADPGVFMRELSDPQALEDIQACVDALLAREDTRGPRVGVTGFCMGGMYALMAGCACRNVGAVVPYYGLLSHAHGILYGEGGLDPEKKPRAPLDYVEDLGCPLLGFFGAEDDFIPLPDLRELENRLGKTAWDTAVVVYEGAGHAFMNDTRPQTYHPGAASDAWPRTTDFLRNNLA